MRALVQRLPPPIPGPPIGQNVMAWMQTRVACPARWPHYVIPDSHWLDPPYAHMLGHPTFFRGGWPWPRIPWPFESNTRAPGTGLIRGPIPRPCRPCCPRCGRPKRLS